MKMIEEAHRIGSQLTVPVTIQGVGFKVPDRIVTNEELTKTLETTDEWIREKTGISERRFLEENLVTSDLCLVACEEALKDANIEATAVDVIILTTASPDQKLPSTAMILKEKLGASNAIPLDLNQLGCAAGIYSIYVATHLLQNPTTHNVLVIGCEILSRITDPADRRTRVFFGDAAGAVLMQKSEGDYGILSFDVGSTLDFAVQITSGGTNTHLHDEAQNGFLQMDGKTVWRLANEKIPLSIKNALQLADLEIHDVDYLLLHQANLNIIKNVMDELQIPFNKTVTTIEEYGNTGSASIFSCLYKLLKERSVTEGKHIVLSAIGAGFYWGTICMKYAKN
ncbi:3-oxoacyl-ACP synthase III family protein [Rummeliibacillus suwonensis]|uniref:3-oxoacyl-ACP synthase III family protein n=1 Tax=Rummeliibacillus suwonensis TaxID=1306154 RepID=UPI001AAFCDFF|nr:ketoacyl-ACP synthase III [Rummeliibacillus suwonensis]MBO2535958.1 ketoacyl-ACP synthase III [Rummeliibacillus suwonensis]